MDDQTNLGEEIKKAKHRIRLLKEIVVVIFIVLVFRSSFYESFRIPSGSMIPTLMIGDFIIVDKMSYGFKLPFSDLSFGKISFDPIYLFGKSHPQRGDVIVFKYPQDKSINYIKRVVGLPGDSVEIKQKVIYINGQRVEQIELNNPQYFADMDDKFRGYNLKAVTEKLGDISHVSQFDVDNTYKMDMEKMIVPAGKYFVMGDNRDFSYDSRFWGFVGEELVKGKAKFVWFSFSLPSRENKFTFRPSRIGTQVR